MKRPTLITLLIAQTVLLFLVAWAGVYFARDEYLLARGKPGDDDEGLAKAAQITEERGVPTVRLSLAAQRNVGLEVALPERTQLSDSAALSAVVIDAQPLIEQQGRLRAARHEADAARATAAASAAERQRVQALFDDDRNASQRALEAAVAQASADAARERSATAALQALRDSARTSWGAELARALEAEGHGLIAQLAAGREVLLRAALRSDQSAPARSRLMLSLPERQAPLAAQPLGVAGPGAGDAGGGRGLLFRAAGSALAVGQRVSAQLEAGSAPQDGVLVPTSAVVWHAGQPWVYIRETNEPQPVSTVPPGDAAGVAAGDKDDDQPAAKPRSAPAANASAPAKPAAARTPAARDDDDDDQPRQRAAAPTQAAAPAASATASAKASGPSATPAASAPAAELDRFQRRAVPHARRVGDRWFLPGYAEDDPVVVRGAQLLLSEELKFTIRNENDD